MEKLHIILNKQVANLSVLFTKLHHHHWYVKGRGFYTLHEKFEELYDEVNELYDEFAERLLTIGGKPASSLEEYLKLTSLKEVKGVLTSDEMVKMVHDDFMLIVKEMYEGVEAAQNVGDEASADLFISTIATLEKHAWMLRYYSE